MKIDVITRHAPANYGSLLQTYAMQVILKELGYESEIINYIRYDEKGKNKASTLLKNSKFWNKNILTRMIYKIIQTPNYNHMYKTFEKYRNDILKQTREYNSLEELKRDLPIADVYCTGSDQVWGKIANDDFDKTYFLDFVPSNKKCIAYSSSFGKEKISENLKKNLPELLKKYDSLLLREQSAVNIVKELGFNNAELVLDPTLLLKKEQWESLIDKSNKKEKYVLVYGLHDNKKFDKYAKEFAKKKNLKLIRVSPSFHNYFKSGKLKWLPTPTEFLTYFYNAEYILTDSFHATVFSLIFNKKFIDILPGETSTRILNILELAGVKKRVLKDYNDFETIDSEIDYESVNNKLEAKRKESIKFLKNAIE